MSKTKNVSGLFGYFPGKEIKGFDTWDTSNIENMAYLFSGVGQIETLDLGSWNTSKVTDMHGMFLQNLKLKTVYVSDKFKTDNVADSSAMFMDTSLLVGGNGTTYDSNHIDKEYARIDVPGSPGYFTRK